MLNTSITVIRLNQVNLDYTRLEIIRDAFLNAQSISILDLSNNLLCDKAMKIITQIIKY